MDDTAPPSWIHRASALWLFSDSSAGLGAPGRPAGASTRRFGRRATRAARGRDIRSSFWQPVATYAGAW